MVPYDQISRLSLDIDRNYGNKRVLTDFPLVNDGSKWTGTINKLIVGFDYTITGHAYKCTDCPEDFNNSDIDNYTITNLAGQAGIEGSTNGQGNDALFFNPMDLAIDNSGFMYLTDQQNNLIRKIDLSGNVSTLAGNAGVSGFENGQGTEAKFNAPYGLSVDSSGNVFVADFKNSVIRKIDSIGNVTTVAGQAGVNGYRDGQSTEAQFNFPTDVEVDSSGNLYVADRNSHIIRKIDTSGNVTTFAGNGFDDHNDGPRLEASFSSPVKLTIDSSNNIYVADQGNHAIRKIDINGNVTTLAGQVGVIGSSDGDSSESSFNYPAGISVDSFGNLFIADSANHLIRKIDTNGKTTTIAGVSGVAGASDGYGIEATFNRPFGIILDSASNVYIADRNNNLIRKLTKLVSLISYDNESHTFQEIFRGDTQHTVTEGTNSLNLRLSPLLDDRELTVPRITRINRPFQMVASTSDNITVAVDTVKKDGSSAVDATLSYRF
ncbi:MAG: hypothetical protein CL937_09490, partial [Deltaproteobacteria bacterium]